MTGKSAEFLEERHRWLVLFGDQTRRKDIDPIYPVDRDPRATFTDRNLDREK